MILARGVAKISCQNKSRKRSQFRHFSISRTAQLPAIRITEQPMLLTKGMINRPRFKLFEYFREKTSSQISYSLSSSS